MFEQHANNETYQALMRDGITAQGDLVIVNIQHDPLVYTNWEVVPSSEGSYTIAHSMAGHHHQLHRHMPDMASPIVYRDPNAIDKELIFVVEIPQDSIGELVHLRPFDTHKPHLIPAGVWVIRRQRRPSSFGWKKIID